MLTDRLRKERHVDVIGCFLIIVMLSCAAIAEEELPYHSFEFAGNMSFTTGWTIEEMSMVSEFQNYKQETQSSEVWASWTAVGDLR